MLAFLITGGFMTNKDKVMIIVDKLFEITEKDFDINISGHCGGMVVGYKNGNEDGFHIHVDDTGSFPDQLQQLVKAVHEVHERQNEHKHS